MPFCDKTKSYTDQPKQFDPLADAGGQAQRGGIYGYLNQNRGQINQAGQNTANAATKSANMFGTTENLANRTINGDFLSGSPELQGQLNANYNRALAASADQDARIRSQFARSGMGFSTGNQQAQEANTAAAAGQAQGQNAQIIGQNYMAERGNQNAAPGMLNAAENAKLSYLSQVPQALLGPQEQMAGIVKGLSGGGTVATPSTAIWNQPGLAQQSGLTSLIGNL